MRKKIIFKILPFFVLAIFVLVFLGCSKKESTDSWKTYKNDIYGYQFKAPKDWKVEKGKDEQTGLVVLKDEKGIQQMTISATQKAENEKEFKGLCYQQNSKQCDKADHGTIQFNAGTGYVYDDSLAVEPRNRRFIILDNERLTFSLVNEDAGKERIIDQIINAIEVEPERREVDEVKEIEKRIALAEEEISGKEEVKYSNSFDGEYSYSEIDTRNWKAYRNEKRGFEIKIPEDWECFEADSLGGLAGEVDPPVVCLKKSIKDKYLLLTEIPSIDYKERISIQDEIVQSVNDDFSFIIFRLHSAYEDSLKELSASQDLNMFYKNLLLEKAIANALYGSENADGFMNFYISKIDGRRCVITKEKDDNIYLISADVFDKYDRYQISYNVLRPEFLTNKEKSGVYFDSVLKYFRIFE